MAQRAGQGDIRTRIEMRPDGRTLERAFREAGAEFGDWRPAWPAAAGAMRASIVRGLHSQGASLGYTWPRGKAVYLRRKLREGYGGRRLVRTGRLWSSAVNARAYTSSKTSVSVGFRGDKFKHLPALQFKRGYWFVGWDDTARREVQEAAEAYVQQVFAEVRRKIGAA